MVSSTAGTSFSRGSDVALQRLVTAEVDLYFATNNSTKTPVNVSERISAMTGVVIAAESIVTSSEAAVGMLDEHEHPVMVLGSDGITTALAHAGIEVTDVPIEAKALLVGLDWELSYERLTRAADAVRAGSVFHSHQHRPHLPGRRRRPPRWGSNGGRGAGRHRGRPRDRRKTTPADAVPAPGERDRSGLGNR